MSTNTRSWPIFPSRLPMEAVMVQTMAAGVQGLAVMTAWALVVALGLVMMGAEGLVMTGTRGQGEDEAVACELQQ